MKSPASARRKLLVASTALLAATGLLIWNFRDRPASAGSLGLSFRAVPGESRELGWPAERIELLVSEVFTGGPAATAGVEIGDRWVAIDSVKIDDECALAARLEALAVGRKVEISFERRGDPRTLKIAPAAADELFEELCAAGDPRACRERARRVGGDERLTLLADACDQEDPRACRELGDHASEGLLAGDPDRARELYDRACDLGDAAGCTRIAFLYSTGSEPAGVVRDDTRATLLFEAACRAGDAAGCFNVGLMYSNTRGTVRNDARAQLGYVHACAGGFAQACTNLGYRYENGLGLLASVERAAKLYERACRGFACQPADPMGCTNLGIFARDGRGGVAKDPARAAELFAQACEADQASGCTNLGRLEEEGVGVERDPSAAVAHYRRGCELGSAGGCRNLANAITEGVATAQDANEVERLFARACELGDSTVCEVEP